MTLRTGLIITGDTEGAQKALDALASDMAKTGAAAQGMAAAEKVAEAATEGLANEINQAKGAIDALGGEAQQTGNALAVMGGRVAATEAQVARMSRGAVRSTGEVAIGTRMMGQQFQDVGLMIGMSGLTVESVMRAISMQMGQVALAAEQMGVKGAVGRAAAFLGGPWGGIILAATAILSPFIAKLFESASAADESGEALKAAAESADSFGNAQSLLGQIIDLTTGKMKTQNAVLVQMIRLQVQANLLKAQGQILDATGGRPDPNLGKPRLVLGMGMDLGNGDYRDQASRDFARRRQEEADYGLIKGRVAAIANDQTWAKRDPAGFAAALGKETDAAIVNLDRLGARGEIAGRKLEDVKLEVLGIATAGNDAAAAYQSLAVLNGGAVPDSLKPYRNGSNRKPPKPRSTEARDEFGRDAADRIAGIIDQYQGIPGPLRQANTAIRQLDDLINDLQRKEPLNWKEMVADANAAKGIIRTGLIASIVEPFDMTPPAVKRASEAMAQLDAVAGQLSDDFAKGVIDAATFTNLAGNITEAQGAIVAGLNRPFSDYIGNQEQALQILKLVTLGREDEAEAARVVFQLEEQIGPLTQDRKEAILATVQALRAEQRELDILRQKQQAYLNALGDVRGLITQTIYEGAGGLAELPERLFDTFKRFRAEWLTQQWFGPVLQQLEDQVTGTHIVKDASIRMGAAVDDVSLSLGNLGQSVDSLAARLDGAAAPAATAGVDGAAYTEAVKAAIGAIGGEVIRVVGTKANTLKDPTAFFADTIGSTLTAALSKGLGIKEESAKAIGAFAGKGVATALQGAAQGQFASGIASLLGIKQNSTGAAIGGAIGNFIPGLPPGVGSMLGGLFGGTIGGLFEKPKYGTANVGSVYGDPKLSGSNSSYGKAAGSLADQVRDGVRSIADQLGGVLGNFDLSIGTFNDRFRVNTFGTDKALHSKNFGPSTLFDFGDDQAAAISFAIADAIKDGGVTGLSAAVQQALRSSTDVQDALQEALKVANVEQLLGGLEAEIGRAFRDFEREAADRLRIARQYGFDVVELEKRNAEDRLKLSERLLEEQVGSLQRLVDEITHGSLFEGSAVDREAKLRQAIAAAEADLAAGKEGAADQVADLFGQLNAVLKEVYGTTGGFATGQAEIVDKARAAIARANEQIRDAQRASDPALATTNAALDENNDQNSKMLDKLDQLIALMAPGAAGSGGRDNGLFDLARTT